MVQFEIKKELKGKRLDAYIKMLFPNVTQTYIFKLLRKQKIKVNRKKVDHKYVLQENDIVQFFVKEKDLTKRVESKEKIHKVTKIDFTVVYEDEEILVVNKPAGLAVHGGDDMKNELTLLDQILHYLEYDETKFKPYLAHRLDRNTSGLIIIGKTKEALEYFFEAFKNGEVKKTYVAVVVGRMDEKEGNIDLPILRKDKGIQKVEINEEEGKFAITHFKVIKEIVKEGKILSLLEVGIETGRTHQIRIHMQAIGHPVLGDRQYGDWDVNKQLNVKIPLLHAWKLEFKHPKTGEVLEFEAEVPEGMLWIT